MPPRPRHKSPERGGRLLLATQSLDDKILKSQRRAAYLYDVPRSTLQRRLQRARTIQDFNAQKRKLSPSEEESLVQWILDLDRRGFPAHIIDVRRMGDVLLAARGQNPPPLPLGKNWVARWINRQSELQTKWNRKFNSQRAKCEDPVKISAWFKLVQETRVAYGILDADTYNFDETGFMMGVAGTSKVVTSADKIGRAIDVQPGNRDWVTAIECINASGWCLPPFIILAAKLHQAEWYSNIQRDWVIGLSDNGWTNDALGLAWVQHFNRYTEARTTGAYRLLILDGHGSHSTPEFDQFCTEHKIITLCMPPHTSHLLQPLDVSCYSPLKSAYGHEIGQLARLRVFHVDKDEFLYVYPRVRAQILSEQSIQSGFRATGLIPFNPDRVLSNLTVVRTPSPPAAGIDQPDVWTTETPRTIDQLNHQAQLVRDMLNRNSQSPTSRALAQLIKGCQMAMHAGSILAEENSRLQATSQRIRQRKDRRRQYIASGGVLQAQEGQALVAAAQIGVQESSLSGSAGARTRAPPTCTNCHIEGHTRRQCRSI
jgi:hypothetical protein